MSTDTPPEHHRFYYGWVIVGVLTLTRIASATQQNPVISIFIKPITGEFGWSRSVFAGAAGIGTILGGLAAVAIGPLIDRHGARRVLFVGFTLLGALLISLSYINALWQFYLIMIASRFLLQGVFNLANNVVVSKWFIRHRGRAQSIPNAGQRIGSGGLPLLAQAIISTGGWRTATVTMGLMAWALTLIPVGGWLRRSPEDMGLAPDGDHPNQPNHKGVESPGGALKKGKPEVSFTMGEALHTRSFYILLAAMAASTFVTSGTNFNMFLILTDRGISGLQAASLLTIWAFVGIPTTFIAGYLADRLPVRVMLMVVSLGLASGLFVLTQVESYSAGVFFAVIHGSFFAVLLFLQNLAFANYYGRGHFGAIRGFITPFQTTANALGPLLATFIFDIQGDYNLALSLFIGIMLTVAGSFLFAPPPHHHEALKTESKPEPNPPFDERAGHLGPRIELP